MLGLARGACAGAVTVLALMVNGCGGGDDAAGERSDRVRHAAAAESPRTFIERTTKLLATIEHRRDCDGIDAVNERSFTRFECPPPKPLAKSMAEFEVLGAEIHGTGAVVDYESGNIADGAAIVLSVTPDRQWGIARFGVMTEPSVGTSDADSRAGYRRAVDDYLEAVRDRDCAEFRRVAFLPDAIAATACKTAFAATAPLAKSLASNPRAGAVYVGGNKTFGFFNLETTRPEPANRTISVVRSEERSSSRYLVLDVTSSPTKAEIRRMVREYERQRRLGGSMQPREGEGTGRKAD